VARRLAVASGAVVTQSRALVGWALLPDWAPNLHPLVVHFPIVLLIAALVVDLLSLVRPRDAWADATTPWLYLAGTISALAAYLTGRQAAAGVLVPGMAQPIVLDHWNWALGTVSYFTALAAVRVALRLTRRRLPYWARATAVVMGLGGTALIVHTAEQGARLVYQHGVGVSPRLPSPAVSESKGNP
jgi:uncharacterized membrane protein